MSSSMRHYSRGEQRLRDLVRSETPARAFSSTDQETAQRNRQLVTGTLVAILALVVLVVLLVV